MLIKTPILITGASGFIGANLTNSLINGGYPVNVILREESNIWRINKIMNKITQQIGNLIIKRNTLIIEKRNITNTIRKLQNKMTSLKDKDSKMNYSVKQSRKR